MWVRCNVHSTSPPYDVMEETVNKYNDGPRHGENSTLVKTSYYIQANNGGMYAL